ncbi:MAG TPA: hypothetical protein VH092_13925 [Urbifossiella sp.]|jgi:hypothetical protein|nr:hypothetical protein [Urbifossiella sp.]
MVCLGVVFAFVLAFVVLVLRSRIAAGVGTAARAVVAFGLQPWRDFSPPSSGDPDVQSFPATFRTLARWWAAASAALALAAARALRVGRPGGAPVRPGPPPPDAAVETRGRPDRCVVRFRVDGTFAGRPTTSYLVHAGSADEAHRLAEAAGVTVTAVVPAGEEPSPVAEVAGGGPSRQIRAGVGWAAVGIGLLDWLLAAGAPSIGRVTWASAEARLHEAVVFGSFAAAAAGLGVWSVRRERPRWVGLTAVGISGTLVLRSVGELVRWL